MNAPTTMPRLLRLSDVTLATGLSRSRIYDLEKTGDFPPRRQLFERAVAWSETEVADWINSRPLARSAEIESAAQ